MNPINTILELEAENHILQIQNDELRSNIQDEDRMHEHLLKAQNDMDQYYQEKLSVYGDINVGDVNEETLAQAKTENKNLLQELQECQESIVRLQGKRQNMEYQVSVLEQSV
ncbi:uncharacterized protein METZ01_LOCUS320213 [marine metagenome]|uniref:Uncharacterized protein n=1 Tax=marine metagenome TaxID=408172 RepID=A0A382P1U7_9ZZZZ